MNNPNNEDFKKPLQMLKIKNVLGIGILLIMAYTSHAQTLQLKGDSVVLVEQGREMVIDSVLIEDKIELVYKSIEVSDNALLKIEALKAKELEKKVQNQNTLLYFLEIRDKFKTLKRKHEKGSK